MYAPQIKTLVSCSHSWKDESTPLDAASRTKPGELFAVLGRFEPVGNDNLHELWLCCPVSAFGNVNEWLREGEVSSLKEFESWRRKDYPGEEKWNLLSAAEYRGYRTICVDYRVVPPPCFPPSGP